MSEDDIEQVHASLCRLRADLTDHVRGERRQLPDTPDSLSVVVLGGQRRLVELVDEVMLGIGNDPDCNCLVRAAEIEIALHRQANLELEVLSLRTRKNRTGRP